MTTFGRSTMIWYSFTPLSLAIPPWISAMTDDDGFGHLPWGRNGEFRVAICPDSIPKTLAVNAKPQHMTCWHDSTTDRLYTDVQFCGEFLVLLTQSLGLVDAGSNIRQVRRQLVNANLKRVVMLSKQTTSSWTQILLSVGLPRALKISFFFKVLTVFLFLLFFLRFRWPISNAFLYTLDEDWTPDD